MEEINSCTVCNSKDIKIIMDDCHDYLCCHDGSFKVAKCSQCGHAFLSIRPYEYNINKYYESGYYTHSQTKLINPKSLLQKNLFLILIQKLKNYIAGRHLENTKPKINGRVFDFGCGSGKLLQKLLNNGWEVHGYEPDLKALELARFSLPKSVLYSTESFFENPQNNNQFELLIMSHVLEHLYEPSLMVVKLSRLVVPGGKMVIRVPDADSIESKIFGKYWRGLEVPRHIQHFCKDSILKLLESIEYESVIIKREALPMSLIESVQFFIINKLKIRLPYEKHVFSFLYLLNYFPSQIFRLFGVSSSLEIHICFKK